MPAMAVGPPTRVALLTLSLALRFQQSLLAQAYLAGGVDIDDFDQNLLALFQFVAYIFDTVRGDLGNVQEPIQPGENFDESAEVGDALHLAEICLVELGRGREFLDDLDRL